MAFALSVAISAGTGLVLRLFARNCDNTLSRRDAYLVVTLTWTVFSLFGTLPFLLGGYLHSFTDAFFETMSGFTTTGATIIDNVDVLPHGILFWRSFTQWLGGLGIVFFTIALLPSLVGGSVKVFAAEATGPIKTSVPTPSGYGWYTSVSPCYAFWLCVVPVWTCSVASTTASQRLPRVDLPPITTTVISLL